MYVAWYGRVATAKDAERQLRRQREHCDAALPPGYQIVANYYDVGPWGAPITDHLDGPEAIDLPRDGGFVEFMAETRSARRTFSSVTVSSSNRLTRRPGEMWPLLRRITSTGVGVIFADNVTGVLSRDAATEPIRWRGVDA